MSLTHRAYFERFSLGVGEYGEILVAAAFGGKKMGSQQDCYDVTVSRSKFTDVLGIDAELMLGTNAEDVVRIQVRSKLTWTAAGEASVIKCSESDLNGTRRSQKSGYDRSMTHLAFVLVETGRRFPDGRNVRPNEQEGRIAIARLMTRDRAKELRDRTGTYIRVSDARQHPIADSGIVDITSLLTKVADEPIE
jgi:hypothetical protein